jgi:3-hydroxyisobutyrate dehydrogenase-like beta-hydroxyacid dehydrogenase
MGHGIAKNLVEKGFPLVVRGHRNRAPIDDLVKRGAKEVKTNADLARNADIVILCVTGAPQVEEVIFGADGVASALRPGLIVVDTSTSEPATTTKTREALAKHDVRFVDAPLARTPVEAEAGRLNVMVGASAEDFARIEPLLKCFAENIFHVGGAGAGHTIKLLNNFVAQAICNATAEAFAVGQRAGIDLKQFVALVSAGLVNSGLFQIMSKTLDGQLDGMKFELNNARKDVRYYTHMAESLGVPTVMGEATHQSLVLACALGFGSKLVPSLVEAQEKLANVKIVPR